jgi:hypothetical protein
MYSYLESTAGDRAFVRIILLIGRSRVCGLLFLLFASSMIPTLKLDTHAPE